MDCDVVSRAGGVGWIENGHLSGTCGHMSNPVYTSCTGTLLADATYSPGCNWTCTSGFTLNSEGTGCDACIVASSCAYGKYLNGTWIIGWEDGEDDGGLENEDGCSDEVDCDEQGTRVD